MAAASAGTFLAMLLHKPLDAVSITSLMSAGGWSARGQAPGQLRVLADVSTRGVRLPDGRESLRAMDSGWSPDSLAFSAGVFLCISLSDLLPEIEFHSHNRIGLTIALVGGVATSYAISLLESGHVH